MTKLDTAYFSAFFLLCIGMLISSCETEQKLEEPQAMHRDYYPVDSGNAYTFRVDSYYYDDFNNTIDTFQFIEKWVIKGKVDLNDTTQYQLQIVLKDSLQGTDIQTEVQTIKKNGEGLQLFAGNQRFLKLTFPVEEGIEWNGNTYNAEPAQTFIYKNVHQQFNGSQFLYDSTATVIEQNQGNLIENQLQKVTYAKNIGPVYQEKMDLAYRGDSIPPENIPWEDKANTGYLIKYHLVDYQVD